MSKRSVVIYDSWGILFKELPDDMAGGLIKMVLEYAFEGGTGPSPSASLNAMFLMIKAKMDEDTIEYEKEIKRRSEAGKKGMARRWSSREITEDNTVITEDNTLITEDNTLITENNSDRQEITNITDSVSVSVSVSDKDKKDILSVSEVVDYLNNKLGTKFKANSKATSSQIKARLAEGYTVDDFKTVIDKKVKAWKDDPKMSAYLRPETLFRPGHFESYLNEIEVKPPNKSSPGSDIPRSTYEKIHNYEERKIDFEALGREMISRS